MEKNKSIPSGPSDLLERAEEAFLTQSAKPSVSSITDLRKLFHELQVYQVELETQNEELRRSQLELQTARDRYAELYNFSPAGHLTLDRKGVIQEANLQAGILLGTQRRELLRQPLIKFIAPSEQSEFARHNLDVFRTGARQSCDLAFRYCADGAPVVLHLECQAYPNERGTLEYCRVALFDVTKQKEVTKERDRLAASWHLLLDSTGEGIYGVDREGRCTFINKAGATMFGYQPNELLGKLMHELVHQRPDRPPYPIEESLIDKVCRTRQGRHVEDEVFWRSDGTAFPVAYSAYPLVEEGAITGAVVVFTDVSEHQRREKQFQALLESAPDAHVIIDQTGRIVLINNQTEKLFGYARHELLGQSIEILVPERFRGKHAGHRAGFMANPQARAMGAGVELYARRKDGSEFPTEISLNSLESDRGLLVTAAIRDLTERKKADKALWESEQRFRELIDLFPIAVYVCDPAGVITQVNRHCITLWGREPRCGDPQERFNGAHKMFLPDGTPLRPEDTPMAQVLCSGIPHRNKELVFERPDGSRITVLVNPIPLWNQAGEIIGAANCMLDITDRKEMEEHLQDTLDRIRTLSQRLDVVREEERRHIAGELHDELGVRLTCLKLELASLHSTREGKLLPRDKIAGKVRSMIAEVDATIASVQRLVVELRPGILDDLGLVAAIEWQCQDFERRSGIRCLCDATQEKMELDSSCTTAAFRICQEALTNVVRHAKATAVGVRLEQVDRHLVLKISDNGIGISPDKLSDSRSFGLMSMRERADALSGQVRIVVEPGRGTTVTVRLPLSRA